MPLDVLHRLLAPLREPPLSSSYPDAPPLLQPATRGLPELDPARCSRDGSCVAACPTGAIVVTEARWTIDAGQCVFCMACAAACPERAIRMGPRVELAGRDRDGLIELVELPGRRDRA